MVAAGATRIGAGAEVAIVDGAEEQPLFFKQNQNLIHYSLSYKKLAKPPSKNRENGS